jgi:outer membrane murein-binding lipoprotein Lpp
MNKVLDQFCQVVVLAPLVLAGCATQPDQTATTGQVLTSAAAQVAAAQGANPMQVLRAPSEMESQYGIQVAHIGLTAAGGMVDARFKVLDATKAKILLGNPANTPMLVASDLPPLMAPHHALRGAKFATGQIFYILYPNSRGAVQPGVPVMVAMGDVRLGPVTAQ